MKGDPYGPATSRVPHPDHSIGWYRTEIKPEVHRALHKKSDAKAWFQTLSFLGMLAASFSLALYFHSQGQFCYTILFTLLYGMQANFLINGMHELGHGHVFKTKYWNGVFCRVVSFLGWLHPDMFFSSHLRHHRYTLNFPYDQEAPQPTAITLKGFLLFGVLNVKGCYDIMEQTFRAACGIYPTKHLWWTPAWEDICYPPENVDARLPAMRWATFLLVGHGAIAAVSCAYGMYLIPVLISLGPFYNGWLFFLCNSTQHVGMHHAGGGGGNATKVVEDFRLTTRSFTGLNPIVSIWYWHMNYHIEHHMYAAVPCYNLKAAHNAIKHDLPPTPNGLWEVWLVITAVLEKQAKDPAYVMTVDLPSGPVVGEAGK